MENMPYTASIVRFCAGMLSLFPAGRQTLVQGDGCITRIPGIIEDTRDKRVQVITTPGTIRRGTVAPLLAQCEDAGIRTVLYTVHARSDRGGGGGGSGMFFAIRL